MNINIKTTYMKRTINALIILLVFLITLPTYAQKVDTVTYKGASCFVYPFKIGVRGSETYFSAINFKSHRKTIIKELKETQWKDLSDAEFKMAYKLFKRQMRTYNNIFKREKGKHKHQFSKAIRENPYPFLEQFYSKTEDVEPCLDPIPDGKYIQYFQEFPLIDGQNKLNFVTDRVAGIFTIKNNMLEGEAMWFNFKGDTLKKGQFSKGLKIGEWTFERRSMPYNFSDEAKLDFIKNGSIEIDTTLEIVNYKKGIRDGFSMKNNGSDFPINEGHYTENEVSGHWIERMMTISENIYQEEEEKMAIANLRHNNVITADYTYASKETIVKQPIIRNGLIYERYIADFNFEFNFAPYNVNRELYKIAFTEEENLELEEERVNSYEGSEYDEEYYGDEYYEEEGYYEGEEYYGDEYGYEGEGDYSSHRAMVYDADLEKHIKRGVAIDSIGLIFKYEGVYERRYPNGQLMFRYEFKDGKLLKEDTIFWDNGKPFDVVTFVPDSNLYLQTIYDYDGKIYNEIVFDSLGDYLRVNFTPDVKKYVNIEGLVAEDALESPYYTYDRMDTLAYPITTDSILIWKSWYKADSTKLYQRVYYPTDRVLKMQNYSITGKSSFNTEMTFGEDFKNWTGSSNFVFKDLTLTSKKSASYSKFKFFYKSKDDTIPQLNVNKYDDAFDITSDEVLYLKEIPFSGPVKITLNANKASFDTKNGLDLSFPIHTEYTKKLEKDVKRYKKTGNSKLPEYLNSLDRSDIKSDHSNYIFFSLFPFLETSIQFPDVYDYGYDEFDYEYGDEGDVPRRHRSKYNEKDHEASAKIIKGHFLNGKPDGVWTVEDQFGNIQSIIPFTNGEINGTVKTYEDIAPIDKSDEYYYYEMQNAMMRDSFPKKKTHYLAWVDNYRNGLQHGESVRYNWLGETELYQNYVDGYKQGKSFERNKLAYTKMNYLDDELDGYMQTYLTLKDQDSILLFDLNFQNGQLQGESKSYHTNGKLSKHGFFLNGLPLDDYEAFDSLGFKYHYVKFLYSFPIEEKIWEENELSVLYTFDWRDSIFFTPSDITSSQSLDRMLSNLGIGMEEFERPYYGRPSLVEKTGIDYHMTKFYPNDAVARDGEISSGKKVGCWKYYSYEGELLYEVEYFDSILKINDSIQFKSKGLLTDFDASGKVLSKSYVIEKFEKYDCSHTDHYEIRQLYTIWQANDSLKRINGYVKNYYDNGVLQNEGNMLNGLPTGVWKYYDPFGKLNQVGVYVQGKRDGRWLGGDLSKTKYLGDICLNPNLPDLEEEIKEREQQLDITITNYKLGKALNKEFYDINWGQFDEKKKKKEETEEE